MSTRVRSLKFWGYILLGIVALSVPLMTNSRYWLYMLTMLLLYVLLVFSLDLQYGYTGLISLAHGAFFGIGAYASGILQVKLHVPFWSAFGLGVLITGLLAVIIGFPMLRTKGPYFALGSLALAALVGMIIFNWEDLTGGYSLIGIPKPGGITLGGWNIDLNAKTTYYYLVFFFLLLTFFIIQRITSSRVGRAFIALREDEELAEAIGVNRVGYGVLSFTISSIFAGIAGGLYTNFMGAIEPAIAGYGMGFNLLAMTIIGGSGTVVGSIIGPFLMWVVPEFLEAAQSYRPLIFGLILVLVIIFMPGGIVGGLESIWLRVTKGKRKGGGHVASS